MLVEKGSSLHKGKTEYPGNPRTLHKRSGGLRAARMVQKIFEWNIESAYVYVATGPTDCLIYVILRNLDIVVIA